ncbi:MAG: SDR family oxidoreductase [Sulfuriferula sp.]|nr:SDR family oxidoreductase [Sulfuriferula sp.]
MKVLLTGATGYVGKLVCAGLGQRWDMVGVSAHADEAQGLYRCDLADAEQVRLLSQRIVPDVIIHAAGDKNLARCEASPSAAYLANVQTTINLAQSFPDARIIYISSDYVFPGDRGGYREDDPLGPVTVYGRTKACAELAGLTLSERFYVLRLSALYDGNATFLRFVRESLMRGDTVNCFEDAFYSPTYYGDFLIVLERLVEAPVLARRIYHACGQRISRYFFAKIFARASNLEQSLIRQSSRLSENAPFIFSDISLENTLTCESLDVSVGRHQEYLSFLELHS